MQEHWLNPNRIRLAVVILTMQWPFKRIHFRYRDLKVDMSQLWVWMTKHAVRTCLYVDISVNLKSSDDIFTVSFSNLNFRIFLRLISPLIWTHIFTDKMSWLIVLLDIITFIQTIHQCSCRLFVIFFANKQNTDRLIMETNLLKHFGTHWYM